MQKTKTMLEWFKTVKDPVIRKKLVAQLKTKAQQNRPEMSLSGAIGGAFIWGKAGEYDYWSTLHQLAVKGQLPTI
jgi:hypothetical protein